MTYDEAIAALPRKLQKRYLRKAFKDWRGEVPAANCSFFTTEDVMPLIVALAKARRRR